MPVACESSPDTVDLAAITALRARIAEQALDAGQIAVDVASRIVEK
jgi:hypothetical protein